MTSIFNQLLISSPNEDGGLVFINGNEAHFLDNKGLAGLFINEGKLLKAVQPNRLEIFNKKDKQSIENEWIDDIHDVLEWDGYYYIVGTMKNSVIKLDFDLNIVEKWVFDGELDSIHINCLTVFNDRVIYSAFGDFKQHRGYKGNTSEAGYVADLVTGDKLIEKLSQPHSVLSYGENILVANSQDKELREYTAAGELVRKIDLGGYTRGVYVDKEYIFVGLSCSRNADANSASSASVVAISRENWIEVDRLDVPTKEIYSVSKVKDKAFEVNLLLHHIINYSVENKELTKCEATLRSEKGALDCLIQEKNNEVNYFKYELNIIKNSFSWKIISFIRNVKNNFFNKTKN